MVAHAWNPATQECQLNEINTDYSLESTHSESLSSKTKIYHHPTNKNKKHRGTNNLFYLGYSQSL